jgi:acetyl-CoA C-acetyltransferase
LDRAGVKAGDVSETIIGTAMLAAATSVAARQINFKIGLPPDTPSLTLDRACCSSMTAIGLAAMKIRLGEAGVVLAGGIESCSQTPFLMRGVRWGKRLGDFIVEDPMKIRNPINDRSVAAVTGEMALEYGVSRAEQDEWACESHVRYFAAHDSGLYKDEILPVEAGAAGSGEQMVIDESPRRNTSLEKLAKLATVYGSPTITAGNAPGLNDGASAAVLMSGAEAQKRGLQPLGEVVAYVQLSGNLESSVYLPGLAILKALQKAGLGLQDLKRIEINEAFAAMPLVSTKKMADRDDALLKSLRAITNVNGGSVALGHPMGASGARVVMAVLRELCRAGGGYGAAAICGGYGQADAVIIKA